MEKITKKEFIELLTKNKSVLIYGSYSPKNLLSDNAFLQLVFRFKTEKKYERTCKGNNYSLRFTSRDRTESVYSFAQYGEYSFWRLDANNVAALLKCSNDISYNVCVYRLI